MSDQGQMPFLDHLEELRWRVLWSVLALAAGSVVGIVAAIEFELIGVFTAPLFSVVQELAAQDPVYLGMLEAERLTFLNLTEPFFFIIQLGFMAGAVLASPVVVYQAWAFLAPALEDRERRAIVPTLVLGLGLFSAGVALAYFVALPVTIRFLLVFGAEYFTPALTAGYYLSLVTRLLLAFGLAFELPVVLVVLTAMGLVSARYLKTKRRHAVVGVAVLAAFVSPGDVPQLTVLLMVPLILLYEFGIVLSAAVERRRGETSASDDEAHDVSVLGGLALATYTWKVSRQGAS